MLAVYVNRIARGCSPTASDKIASLADRAAGRRTENLHSRTDGAGLGGLPVRTPLNARTVGVLERDNYRIEKVIFESQPRFFVTGNLYLPKQGRGPYPGVFSFRSDTNWARRPTRCGSRCWARWPAKGTSPSPGIRSDRASACSCTTLISGHRRLRHSTTEHTIQGIQCLLAGDNLARYTVWDGMRALDYLLSRPEVDSTRIAVHGQLRWRHAHGLSRRPG